MNDQSFRGFRSCAISICLPIILLAGCIGGDTLDLRGRLLAAARTEDPHFPPEVGSDGNFKLTKFAYIGRVETVDGSIHVVEMQAVTVNARFARGQGRIMFFDSGYRLLGGLDLHDYPPPLWCKGSMLYLQGRSSLLPQNSGGAVHNGNALDLSDGWENRRMIDVFEPGSSPSPWDNPMPDKGFRRREMEEWDAK